ncbi:MAG: HAD-IB family hydrolase [Actinomycetota bacterium]|nr:HAD-IB family hydrolase [Actinomycetota bacterium]
MTTPARTIAAFDLDGTLTRGDTLLPFLRRARGRTRVSRALVVHSLILTRAIAVGHGRDGAKESLLADLLHHQDVSALRTTAASFAEEVVRRRLRPAVLERVRAHQRAGHELVIVSASPEIYVDPIGRLLGFDATLATRLEADPRGRLTGRIAGVNCRGAEKTARFRAWAGDAPLILYAYGDSAGDRELLAAADIAFRLRRGRWHGVEGRPVGESEVVGDDPGVRVDG